MTFNKNDQQQDARSSADLLIKWMKTTLKTLEEAMRRSHSRSVKAQLMMDGDGDDAI